MVLIGYVPNSEPGGEMWSFWDDLDLAIDSILGEPDFIKAEGVEFITENMG